MNYTDFQLRAWKVDEQQAQVIVHSSPVGDMRKPITVPFNAAQIIKDFEEVGYLTEAADRPKVIKLGRLFSKTLLPRPVYNLLKRSLEKVAPEDGLRVRLCLDEALTDFNWELMYRPDVTGTDSLAGFLVLDPRVSIVREAPTTLQKLQPTKQQQRLIFAGMLESDDSDRLKIREEYEGLSSSLKDVAAFISVSFIKAAGDNIELALMKPAAVFHFSGYAMEEKGRGFLVREMKEYELVSRLAIENLGGLLQRAQTKLAVFTANDTAKWIFVEPLIRAGLPAIVAIYGVTSTDGPVLFAQKLYASLAVGLSLDEAVTWARLKLLEDEIRTNSEFEWSKFVVYMPTAEAVLLPRPEDRETLARQNAAQQERQQTIDFVAGSIGIAPTSQPQPDKGALRQLLVDRFNLEDLSGLCADVEQELTRDKIEQRVNLDLVGGGNGLESKALALIDFLERRGLLNYLVKAARALRPEVFDKE